MLFAISGVLTGISWILSSGYYVVTILLGWRAYATFPPLAGILALILVYLDGDTERTLADIINQHIKRERIKNALLKLFKVRVIAIIISALAFGPFLTPLIVNSCVKGRNKVYFWAIFLNVATTALGIYCAGLLKTIVMFIIFGEVK